MAKKHPSSNAIQAMLREGHFGQSRELPEADPLTATQMRLEIDRIKPYDRNPRRERNPLYDEIKASIRAQGGLNTPLTVTRRPGEERYLVESGGNTRLQILHELWAETEDERFYHVHCLFRPWICESHVLTAHLIENDKRGALTFIDKALGVRALSDVLASETGAKLSQRQLVEALKERGYALDQSMVSRMDYAVDVLLPLIPEALRTGMGTPQIRRVRRLETACRGLWTDQGEAADAFEALLSEALAAHDGPHWDLDAVQRALEIRMAETLDLSLKQVRLELDARLAGTVPDAGTATPPLDLAPPAPRAELPKRKPPAGAKRSEADRALATRPTATTPVEATAAEGADGERAPVQPTHHGAHDTDMTAPVAPVYEGPSDLKSLRSRSYVLALKIAKRHDLEDCITPAVKLGLGFLVDLPGEPIIPVAGHDDALTQLYRQWVWWLLLSLSEAAVQPERMERVPEDVLLRNLILERNDTQALTLVGEPDWKALGYELLNNPSVPEKTFEDLVALAQTCRRIRQQVEDHGGLVLWQTDG